MAEDKWEWKDWNILWCEALASRDPEKLTAVIAELNRELQEYQKKKRMLSERVQRERETA